MEVRIPPELLVRAKGHDGSDEELVSFLKGEGLSKALSVIAFSFIRGVSPSEAKQAVHISRAWADRRELDEVVQRTYLNEARA